MWTVAQPTKISPSLKFGTRILDFDNFNIIRTKKNVQKNNHFEYLVFGKYSGFANKARGFCIHVFLVNPNYKYFIVWQY